MDIAPEDQLHDLIAAARRAGADAAEAHTGRSIQTKVAVRLGKLETVQREEPEGWSLRVWVGARSASLASIDFSDRTKRDALVERALTMARLAPEDPHSGLAPADLVRSISVEDEAPLQLFDPTEPRAANLEEIARTVEAAALAVKGVTNSYGGEATSSHSHQWRLTSDGFVGCSRRSWFSLSTSAIAGENGVMEVDGYGRGAPWREDLPAAEQIGAEAGRRAVDRLGARKLATTRAPVIFERRLSMAILRPYLSAINGGSVARGSSFLKHRLGERVFAPGIRVMDDPTLVRGLASRLVNSEGLPAKPWVLVDDGVLTGWITDVASARQLGLTPNGLGVTNLTMEPGADNLETLMAQAGTGLLVTNLFGPSLNPQTGDWSAGASGVWFEKGGPAYPVNEITVAGCLPDFYARLIPGSDLVIEASTNAPSLLIDAVSIAGA